MSAPDLMNRLSNLYNSINDEIAPSIADDRLLGKLDSWRIALNDAMAALQATSIPPRTYLDAGQWDHITAWLALPVNASGAEVEQCIKAAIKRLAELELKMLQRAEPAKVTDVVTFEGRIASLEERVQSLEATAITVNRMGP